MELHGSICLIPGRNFSFTRSVGVCLSQAPFLDVELFIGRHSDMNKMKELLKPSDKSQVQRRTVLGGLGGIGKTQFAISFAKHHSYDYESIFWRQNGGGLLQGLLIVSYCFLSNSVNRFRHLFLLPPPSPLLLRRGWARRRPCH